MSSQRVISRSYAHTKQLSKFCAQYHSSWPSAPRFSSTNASANSKASKDTNDRMASSSTEAAPKKKKKTQAELDKEIELKMQGLAGDGGDAGIELEDGQPVSMKRSVKNNMFRYI